MKKLSLAIALALVALLFASCKKENKIEQQIIGKWITTDVDGKAAMTNEKRVLTFLSATEALFSTSRVDFNAELERWSPCLEYSVVIDGNKVTITGQPNEHITLINEMNIHSITATEMYMSFKHFTLRDGEVISTKGPMEMRWVKITTDYKQAILGKWQGHVTSAMGSAYDDGEDHQWEYLDDGTFRYYLQDEEGNWVTNPDQTLSEYFVDGTLLCTRWVIDGTEYREWWEIASIANGVMKWTALRQNEDDTTYTATFQMEKVE